ncbi:TPA: tetratricopeptide repeat protein [Bacillus anthracis]|nr:tetratricopeptide repeat protein [Bacillus anthracis]
METRDFTNTGYALLQEWYLEMVSQHTEKTIALKQVIDEKFNSMKEYNDLLDYYTLFNCRFQMLIGNFEHDLGSLSHLQEQPDSRLQYYYHFFKFIYTTEMGQYPKAEHHLRLAEELLPVLNDELENAEFQYRVGLYHYYLSQPTLAVKHTSNALAYFEKDKELHSFHAKVGACKNTIGMSLITLDQHAMAEEYLISALSILEEEKESKAALTVRYNLGVFYSNQKLWEISLRHLGDVYEKFSSPRLPYQKKGIHTLAEVHYNLGNYEKARIFIAEGLEDCTEEYHHRYNILNALVDKVAIEELEPIVLEAIAYFKDQNILKEIQNYSEFLANECYNIGMKDKASDYYRMSYEAKILIKEKGYLR